ncbi:Glucanosyltransferase-domain-containing protein [Hysterangium stoloniferum]|nr:Glucanosyltransferase-domain-containing protein [Hysterangium stoloniferum]
MKGETCIRGATVLTFENIILEVLRFMKIGQINVSTVPRGIAMVRISPNNGLESATGDPTPGLYNNNASVPLQAQNGLRQVYSWGFYSHCAYVDSSHGTCANSTFANKFVPFDSILADTPSKYSVVTRFLISRPNTTFSNSPFLATSSRAAFYLIFVGTICVFLALISGIPQSTLTFIAASVFATLAATFLLVGAAIWTAIIRQVRTINHFTVESGAPLGIEVSFGSGLWLLWASSATLSLSLLPYFVRYVVAVSVGLLVPIVESLQKVSRIGRYLYTEDGNRFSFKGIAYQQQGTVATDPNNNFPEPNDFIDPLADSSGCARDLSHLTALGVNSVRVYSVNSSLDHDSCMQALESAGIYTIIDLSLPANGSINRAAPSWTVALLDQYIETIDAFLKYDNVIAFNVANEVVAQVDTLPNATAAAPYIKAAARDVKAYLRSKNSSVLVGYSSTDGPDSWRIPLANYLACNSDATSIDLFGLNNYEWCGDSDFQSAYAGTNADFVNYTLPVYFSEFGCATSPPRLWTEVQALFGGMAFSYFPADGGFGMVTLSQDNSTVAQYNNVTLVDSPTRDNAGQDQFPACAPPDATFLASTSLPPTPNESVCHCTFRETDNPGEAVIVGQLIDIACSLFGQQGGSCSPIGGSGSSGQYGSLSYCDPITKLDYVFSAYYDITNRNSLSCDFAGNASLIASPPSPAAAAAAATSCVSNAAATFTPQAPGTGSDSGGATPTSTSSGSSSNNNAAVSSYVQGFLGIALTAGVIFISGVWTLS